MVWPSAEGLRVDLSNRPHTMTTTPSSKGASAHKLEHYYLQCCQINMQLKVDRVA